MELPRRRDSMSILMKTHTERKDDFLTETVLCLLHGTLRSGGRMEVRDPPTRGRVLTNNNLHRPESGEEREDLDRM